MDGINSQENNPYVLSFTGASLSVSESLVIAETYLELMDWEATSHKIFLVSIGELQR